MKTKIAAAITLMTCSLCWAEVRNINAVMSKATAADSADLSKLLEQITLKPMSDPKTGKSVFKVMNVKKDSFWEKQGIKIGDFMTM